MDAVTYGAAVGASKKVIEEKLGSISRYEDWYFRLDNGTTASRRVLVTNGGEESEEWTFTLYDDTTITRRVVIANVN